MWNRFEEDLVHMKALGLAVYRFSVEWSRVEPEEGQFDDAALERYRGWCVQLREAAAAVGEGEGGARQRREAARV